MTRDIGTPGDLARLLGARHSCRAFLPHAVPRPVIDEMLELAQRAPSWCNSQPWQAIVTEGAGTDRFRDALYAHAAAQPRAAVIRDADFDFPQSYEGTYKARQRECGWALYRSVGIGKDDGEASKRQALENFRLFGAPHCMIVTTERALGVYGAIDCGGYVATLMLAAQSLGLATIAQAAIAGCAGFVRRYFDLPDSRQIVCAVSFGFADRDHPANGFRTARAPLDEVATYVG